MLVLKPRMLRLEKRVVSQHRAIASVIAGIAHAFSPPGQYTALSHLTAEVFHRLRLEKSSAWHIVGINSSLSLNLGGSRGEMVVFISQLLAPVTKEHLGLVCGDVRT